jgi:hypothetical protein
MGGIDYQKGTYHSPHTAFTLAKTVNMNVPVCLNLIPNLNHCRQGSNRRWLILIQYFLLKYSHFYSLIPERYPDQSSFSLFDKKRILISGGIVFMG